jgi:16S rRNA processing protein RimM
MVARERFEIGIVIGAHGIRGALRVRTHDPDTVALTKGRRVVLKHGDDEQLVLLRQVAAVGGRAGAWRIEIDGVDDRDAALALVGRTIEIDRAALPPVAADEFYLADAMGLPVRRRRDDVIDELGTVVAITTNGAQDLFEIRYRHDGRTRTWLLPVLPGFVLDVTTEVVWVDPPLGMVPDELDPLATAEPE